MIESTQTTYDAVPYDAHPFPQTHPDRLATIATLFGLTPAPVDHCRVLEIGCASGENIVPMAEQYPGSTFLGIDLSRTQIHQAQETIGTVGLQNVQCRCEDIMAFDCDAKCFDYIICHGVFSWVPRQVQERILEICNVCLDDLGIAYISYNTLPGWRMRGIVREMMCFHANRFDEPSTRIRQARSVLEFLANSAPQDTPYGAFLRSEARMLQSQADSYLFHEHLEDVNDPIYFIDMVKRASVHGLQYLGEAELSSMYAAHLPRRLFKTLERIAQDLVQMEQYVDFLRNRMFRQTLFCRQGVSINRGIDPAVLTRLHISSMLSPVDGVADLSSASPLRFRLPASGRIVTITLPLLKASLAVLHEAWPCALDYPTLLVAASNRLRSSSSSSLGSQNVDDRAVSRLANAVLEAFLSDCIELRVTPPACLRKIPSQPVASRLARHQAMSRAHVTNRRHRTVRLDDLAHKILPLLDGTRDRGQLNLAVRDLFNRGPLVTPQWLSERGLLPVEGVSGWLEPLVDQALMSIARSALLISND